uniref:60S ribosomal protein L13, putative n=3 Tax=Entamoeba histolytica TaxID=5759 RepID=S0AY80_ENTHI|nr:60S ribosomal protein L13, putative [Entamoeba histolytica]BAN37524.1 60S ribosomal protein L13, putative [Entamoeba histolytica]BAN37652.1 60S ribosomal protein L13, putative [Entamoeba histolytica]BAN38209.1 60S ribosomal protein L13, putative [Entamoeba histolytica]BAN38495.1 60S ribosomal protein L13, putative [Entamoeba histolytica]
MKHNQAVSNIHFCKDWRSKVHTWFKQPFRKIRRHQTRVEKAKAVFPATIKSLKPSVHCMNQRFNYKLRLGRGFTLKELRAAKIDKNLARTIGIAVDPRRKESSKECLNRNAQRLTEYMNRLVVLPKVHAATAKRLVLNKKNAEAKTKKAAEIKKFIAEHNKTIKELKIKVAAAKKDYAKTKDAAKAKELKACLKGLKKAQVAFAAQVAKEQKKTKQFNKLPVQQKEAKQVLDSNKVIRLTAPCTLETKTLTKGMKAFDAVAHLRKAKNVAKAVSGIVKGQKKANNAPSKKQ